MHDILISQIETSGPQYKELLHFRNDLLRKPLGLNLFEEDLRGDITDFILVASIESKIIGCVMLQPKDNEVIKLRQMAVSEDLQGKGIGRVLMEHAENLALQNGFKKVILHARTTAEGFYRRLGYSPFGHEFTEVTIPHIAMEKTLV